MLVLLPKSSYYLVDLRALCFLHCRRDVGQHIFLKGTVDGKPVMRAYTPVGYGPYYVEFIIKVYFPLPPKFPEGGKLTQHMHAMREGDTLGFKGPLGEINFDQNLVESARARPLRPRAARSPPSSGGGHVQGILGRILRDEGVQTHDHRYCSK